MLGTWKRTRKRSYIYVGVYIYVYIYIYFFFFLKKKKERDSKREGWKTGTGGKIKWERIKVDPMADRSRSILNYDT